MDDRSRTLLDISALPASARRLPERELREALAAQRPVDAWLPPGEWSREAWEEAG